MSPALPWNFRKAFPVAEVVDVDVELDVELDVVKAVVAPVALDVDSSPVEDLAT
jgi:hypothetical protein